MTRYLGYSDRQPYLWWADTETLATEPAGDLRDVPVGIDQLVPLESAVAIECGLDWYGLPPSLSGPLRPLTPDEVNAARSRSRNVDVSAEWNGPAMLERAGRSLGRVQHPEVAYWYEFATLSPDGQTVAIGGSTVARPPADAPLGPMFPLEKYEPTRTSVMALVDVESGNVQVCDGRFDEFCYPPAWSANGESLAFGAPFEAGVLHEVIVSERVLRPLRLGKDAPMPMVDADLLPGSR